MDIVRIIDEWITVYKRRGTKEGIKYLQVFEVSTFLHLIYILSTNLGQKQLKGAMVGCSNAHTHGQVWSLCVVPSIPGTELASLQRYANKPLVD